MEAENRRKEEQSEAETKGPRENLTPLLKSAMANEAEQGQSLLPTSQQNTLVIEDVVEWSNMQRALKAVTRNKGAPGIDGVTTKELEITMWQKWPKVKQEILEGKYIPNPVRRVGIPKPDGNGIRQLGIPTVMDRVIQQAVYQVLLPVFDPTFSKHSYGFRPNRNAQRAVEQAQEYIQDGYEWVVDIDLEKFFDKVNHDILMSRVARRVKDKKILLLIRRFLQSGIMEDGLVKATEEGTPQGGPLSPLLSNIILDDFDKELERRGLRFVRYADDCNTYVKTEKAGKRVMEVSVRYLSDKLRLKVNEQKSAVDNPWNRKFLGFTFRKETKGIVVHESRIKRFKDKIRGLTKKMRGSKVSDSIRRYVLPITRGWANYFGIADEKGIFESLDGWIRRKIRGILWRQWKKPRTRYKRLLLFGLNKNTAKTAAYSSKGPWRMACTYAMHKAVSNKVIEAMGYISMANIARAWS